jgi:hypothetical protein
MRLLGVVVLVCSTLLDQEQARQSKVQLVVVLFSLPRILAQQMTTVSASYSQW